MRYQSLTIAVVFLAIIFIAVDSSNFLQKHIMAVGDVIKVFVLDSKEGIITSYQRYINQARTIAQYEEKLKNYQKLEIELHHIQNEMESTGQERLQGR